MNLVWKLQSYGQPKPFWSTSFIDEVGSRVTLDYWPPRPENGNRGSIMFYAEKGCPGHFQQQALYMSQKVAQVISPILDEFAKTGKISI